MNPLELYKRLPRKNCGKCSLKTCMPFALAVMSGAADLSECTCLTEEEIASLKESITVSDWRGELILRLREEIRGIDLAGVAEGIGAEMKDGKMVLKCFGREFLISPDGEISSQGRMTPWINILLLHYMRTAGKGDLTGKWVSYGELKGGMVKISSFRRECEEPLREVLDRDLARAEIILSRLGAVKRGDFPTKDAWQLYLLPKMPIAILYWPREEEFPSRMKILFDSSADKFLDAECIIFLVEGLVRNMEQHP